MEYSDYPSLGERVYHEVLPNGMKLFVVARPDYGKQFAFFSTHYGGMNLRFRGEGGDWVETPAGVAHYLEHKMFDTEDGNAQQVLAANGASDNAFTSSNITGYYFEGTHGFEENLRTLLSFVSVPWFTEESVRKEQGIIGQEIRMGEDDPYSELYDRMMEMLYVNHPVRTRVIGTVESIAGITVETLYQCHKAFYRPGNMGLCVAGNVDPEKVKAIACEVLPKEHSAATESDLGRQEPMRTAETEKEWEMPVAMPIFNLGMKGEPAEPGERLRQRLTAELACDALIGPSSDLYTILYEKGLINNSFGGGYESVDGAAYLLITGESRDPRRVRDEILAKGQRLARDGIESALWERIVRAAYGTMVRRLNSLEGTCIELAESCFEGENYFRFPEVFQSIEKADAERLLDSWCRLERTAMTIVKPLKEQSE